MSDCESICGISISDLILRGLEIKKWRLGATPKKRDFSSALPQENYAMLITLASVQLVQKHHRENTSPEYNQRTCLLRPSKRYRVAYSTTSE